jgi:hypothetical protein
VPGLGGILGDGTPNSTQKFTWDITREFSAGGLVSDGRLKTAEFNDELD